MVDRPKSTAGMRHVALVVNNMEACEKFYCDLLGMNVEWKPDSDNVYLTSGNDNLALHRGEGSAAKQQILDHIGFIIDEIDQVDAWYRFMVENNVPIVKELKTHRDGARSFYCKDPENVTVQIIYHPPLAGTS